MKYLRSFARFGGLAAVLAMGAQLAAGASAARFDRIHEHWRWSHFDVSTGLPSQVVHEVVQAGDGTVWIATSRGVAWFDGFFWYPAKGLAPVAGTKLLTGAGATLYALEKGCLFEGTRDGFSPQAWCKERSQFDAVPLDTGETLVSAGTREPWLIEGATRRRSNMTGALEQIDKSFFRQTRRRAVWWADVRGLFRMERGESRLLFPSLAAHGWEKLGLNLAGLAENDSGSGVAAIIHPAPLAGVWEWTKGEAPRRSRVQPGLEDIRALDVGADGEIVLVHRSGHVWLKPLSGEWHELSPLPPGFEQVNHIRFDRAGDVWLATETGVHLYRRSKPGWRVWTHPFPDSRNSINGLTRARDGTLWLANGAGVEQVRIEGERLDRLGHHALGLSTGVAEDEEGNIWASSGLAYGGAWRWDGRRWKHFGRAEGLTDNRIHRIMRDRQNRLWFAATDGREGESSEGAGAFLLAPGRPAGGFEHWSVTHRMPFRRVYGVASAPDGTLYFAATEGLARYRAGAWTAWSGQGPELLGVPFAIAVTAAGTPYWVDRGHGLGTLGPGDAVQYQTQAEGLLSNSLWELAADDDGALWAAGQGGVSALRGGEWSRFGMELGLPVERVWPLVRASQDVCVGTVAGLACLAVSTEPNRTLVRINGIEEKDGLVSVRLQAAAYMGSQQSGLVETRYRVDDGVWSDWGRHAQVELRSISAGTHTMEAESRGMKRTWARATREFRVRGPFYLRAAFWIPVGIPAVTALTLYGVLRRRTHQSQSMLKLREHHYRSLIENGLGGVTLINRDFERTYESPAVHRLLGFDVTEMSGRSYGSLVYAEDRREFERMLEEAAARPSAMSSSRYRVRHRDGRCVWLNARAHNLLDEPAVRAIVINYQDVTAQVEGEQELERARDAAESASRVKSEFLATMSHEIRTPMNGITGMTSLLAETGLNAEQREYADSIRESAQALLGLINDILDVSRIEAGQMSVELRPFDLRRTTSDVLELLRGIARGKGLELRLDYPAALPSNFSGDGGRVRQILVNLVGNAIKFTSQGEVAVRVEGSPRQDGVWRMSIEVADSGIGIPPEKLELVFDQFVQADASTTRVYGGTGLGLAISRSLARLMGGDIGAASEIGVGSRFTLRLPLESLALAGGDNAGGPHHASGGALLPAAPLWPGRRILLAEDNAVNRRVATRLLEKMGAHVDTASNGIEALDKALSADYDLVLMDWHMPEMDGLDATRMLRASGSGARARVPVAALTANAMSGDRERCLEAGMNDFLAKPIDAGKLAALLERVLSVPGDVPEPVGPAEPPVRS